MNRKKVIALALACFLLLALLPVPPLEGSASAASGGSGTLVFSADKIEEAASGSGYDIDGTTLIINQGGTYALSGSCGEGSVVIAESTTGVVLNLDGFSMASTTTAPFLCGEGAEAALSVSGSCTLNDKEADDSLSSFEGTAIQIRSGGSVTITGDGTLTISSSGQNGIKGGTGAAVSIEGGTVRITSPGNGINVEGQTRITGGTVNINAGEQGIRAVPEIGGSASDGSVFISGGSITINTQARSGEDCIQAANDITITGGTFDLDAHGDGLQSAGSLSISGGTFNIKTLTGHDGTGFSAAVMSCKGIKASATDADTENAANVLRISGGEFTIDAADDAIHSDGTAAISGGSFSIKTRDDAIHADTSLSLGRSGGLERDPFIEVESCFKGFEAGTVSILSGKYRISADDDGVSSGGGSGKGTEKREPIGKDHFNVGENPSIRISGGELRVVSANGNGLDSRGDISFTGGSVEVWAQLGGENNPIELNGSLTIKGARVFAAGTQSSGMLTPDSGSQQYRSYSYNVPENSVVAFQLGTDLLYNTKAQKAATHVFLSTPDMSGAETISLYKSITCANDGTCSGWAHPSWNGPVTTPATASSPGFRTYTCTVCGAEERESITAALAADPETPPEGDDPASPGDSGDNGDRMAVFTVGAHCSVEIYPLSDAKGGTIVDTIDAGTTKTIQPRNGATGVIDTSSSGEVNFTVTVSDGYDLDYVIPTSGSCDRLEQILVKDNIYSYRMTGLSGTVSISVAAKLSVTEISVKTSPNKTSYFLGDSLDPAGLTITVTYGDKSTRDFAYGEQAITCSPMVLTSAGTQIVTVTYEGKSSTFSVSVTSVSVKEIQISKNPTKTTYNVGEEFDASGLEIQVIKNQGEPETVAYNQDTSSHFTFTGFNSSEAGERMITVFYDKVSTTFVVEIQSATVGKVAVFNSPNAIINIFYTSTSTEPDEKGATRAVTRDPRTGEPSEDGMIFFEVKPQNTVLRSVSDGVNTLYPILGRYKLSGLTKNAEVTVVTEADLTDDSGSMVERISVNAAPARTSYVVGETLDPAGLTLLVTYVDDSVRRVSYYEDNKKSFSFSPTELTVTGTLTITVTYATKTDTFSVVVRPYFSRGDDIPIVANNSIPVSGTNGTVNTPVSLSNGMAMVTDLTDNEINVIVNAGRTETDVMFDLRSLQGSVTAVSLPSTTFVRLYEALRAHVGSDTLSIATAVGKVQFDETAMRAIAAPASAGFVVLTLENVPASTLNDARKDVLKGKDLINAYELGITSNGRTISSFDGGTAKVTLPLSPRAGSSLADYSAWYCAENGAMERMESTAGVDSIIFSASRFSVFFLLYSGLPFTDVAGTQWYFDAVSYCYENQYFQGVSSTRFSPLGTMNRAMFATVLYRLAGQPSVMSSNPFLDVQYGRYYTNSILWAVSQGIISGYGNGYFGTEDPVTREQMVTLFWRWSGYPYAPPTALMGYTDTDSIQYWAQDAFAWAVYNGIISGKGGGILDPGGTATRAEVAQIVYNYCNRPR